MNKDVREWLEKISNETATCRCGLNSEVILIIRKHFPGVEVRAYCMNCDKTVAVREPLYLVKEAHIDIVEQMIKVLKRKFKEG